MQEIKRGRPKLGTKKKLDVDRKAVHSFSAPIWFVAEVKRIADQKGILQSEMIRQILTEALQIQRPQL
jgi:hypothetical protein